MTERIVIAPEICNGRPTIRGTRITAQTVLGHLSAGDSIEDVLEASPRLTRENVLAALAYGAMLSGNSVTFESIRKGV